MVYAAIEAPMNGQEGAKQRGAYTLIIAHFTEKVNSRKEEI